MTDRHHTQVWIAGIGGEYVVVCDLCDRVGQPQQFEADAQAIAARHEEIGGCER